MKVTVFSSTNCGVCHGVMEWLDSNDIEYSNKIVDTSEESMEAFMEVNEGMIGTPFTVIEDEGTITKIVGFDQPKFKQALSI